MEEQLTNGGCILVGESSSGLDGEPGLIGKAVGGGVFEGSGGVQDGLDLEVAIEAMLVWAELMASVTWCTGISSGGIRPG